MKNKGLIFGIIGASLVLGLAGCNTSSGMKRSAIEKTLPIVNGAIMHNVNFYETNDEEVQTITYEYTVENDMILPSPYIERTNGFEFDHWLLANTTEKYMPGDNYTVTADCSFYAVYKMRFVPSLVEAPTLLKGFTNEELTANFTFNFDTSDDFLYLEYFKDNELGWVSYSSMISGKEEGENIEFKIQLDTVGTYKFRLMGEFDLGEVASVPYEFNVQIMSPENPSFIITFYDGGGTGSMPAITFDGKSYTLPACGYTAPLGKHFAGWRIDGKIYQPGETVSLTSDINVYASWALDADEGKDKTDSNPQDGSNTKKKLEGWVIALICVGAVLLTAGIILLLITIFKNFKQKGEEDKVLEASEEEAKKPEPENIENEKKD